MTTPEVSVIIVSYGTRDLTLAALETVRGAGERVAIEAIVVDNASLDDSAARIAEAHPQATLIRSPQNLGFAAGANLGAGRAVGEWLLFLNSDARLLEDSIPRLLDAARSLAVPGAIGPLLLGPDGPEASVGHFYGFRRDWAQFLRVGRLFPGVRALDGIFLGKLPERREAVEWITGACLLVRRDTFFSVGGFDEAYFMYVEDMDLCFRLRRAGCTNLFAPDAVVRHELGASPREPAFLVEGGTGPEYFVRKFDLPYPWILQRGRRVFGVGLRVVALCVKYTGRRLRGDPAPLLRSRIAMYRSTLLALVSRRWVDGRGRTTTAPPFFNRRG